MSTRDDVAMKAAVEIFGDLIRRKRQASRWTCYSLAEKSGVDETVISQIEAGESAGTECDREKLCEFFGIDIGTFAKILRIQQAQAANEVFAARPITSNVVQLEGYRAKWQKTTTPPTD